MIYSFLYVLVMSVAIVFIQKLDMSIPPLVSLLVTASIASIYFNLINRHDLKKIYLDCWNNKTQWMLVMLIVLVMWGTSMIGPGVLGASLFNFIYFAWLGMLGFISLSLQNWPENRNKVYFGICLLILNSINVFFELRSALSYSVICGIVLSLAGGTASFVYFKQSQALAKKAHLSATQVLAVRFYLSILAILIFLPKHHIAHYFTWINLINFIVLAFFSLIIPLYFSQKALEKITSEQHAIINSLCPLITGIVQEMIFNDVKKEQMVIYFAYFLAILSFYYINKYSRKMEFSK